MGLFDSLLNAVLSGKKDDAEHRGIIATGRNKNTGGHDHRTNSGDDRTPAQKQADKAKRKS